MKKIITVFLCFAFSLMLFIPVNAETDDGLPRVVDNADLFTDMEEEELDKRVASLNDKYNISYVLLTDIDNQGKSREQYSADFLTSNGYADARGAVVFYLNLEPGGMHGGWRTTAIGSCEKVFDKKVIEVIEGIVEEDIKDGNYYDAFLKHIDFVKELYKNGGKLPLKYRIEWDNVWISLIVAAVVGAVVGGMRLSSCKKKMQVVAPVDAHQYLEKGSFDLRDKRTFYLYSTVTKTAKQKSGGSSGGSSYSSGSSGGRSYSSGGRDF